MDTSLVRSPVYQQLNQRLRAALATEYRSGDQFLTEREVAGKFHVSRATANKSLASLVSEGFLEFRKGLGTFVRRDVIDYDVRSLVSFTEKARAAGKKPKTELLTFGKLLGAEVEASIRTALRVESETLLWEMERVRLADGVPVILEQSWSPPRNRNTCRQPIGLRHWRSFRLGSLKTTRHSGGNARSIAATNTNSTAGSAPSNPRLLRAENYDELKNRMS